MDQSADFATERRDGNALGKKIWCEVRMSSGILPWWLINGMNTINCALIVWFSCVKRVDGHQTKLVMYYTVT